VGNHQKPQFLSYQPGREQAALSDATQYQPEVGQPIRDWRRARDVEEMMAERGVVVTYETSRDWSQKFGGTYAKRLRSRARRPGDRWYLDEVYLSINGRLRYLWRAVDQEGEVLDILVQPRRNKQAAKKFFRKLLKGLQYIARAIVTDKLGSYAAAKAEVLPDVEHLRDKRSNNRAENSHQPTRTRASHAGLQVSWVTHSGFS
jgi:putative transposase